MINVLPYVNPSVALEIYGLYPNGYKSPVLPNPAPLVPVLPLFRKFKTVENVYGVYLPIIGFSYKTLREEEEE